MVVNLTSRINSEEQEIEDVRGGAKRALAALKFFVILNEVKS
jgi:hypothetical protein